MIGHSRAGKTSFIDRLLGKEFQEQNKSTEGIHTHFIISFFNNNDLGSQTWTERKFEASILEKDFHDSVLEQRELETNVIERRRKIAYVQQSLPEISTELHVVEGLSPQDMIELKRKVGHWLQSIPGMATEPHVVKDSSPRYSVDELHQSSACNINHSEKDLSPKDSNIESSSISEKLFHDGDAIAQLTIPEIKINSPSDSTSETDTDNQNGDKMSVVDPSAIPKITKISSEEFSRLIEKKKRICKTK